MSTAVRITRFAGPIGAVQFTAYRGGEFLATFTGHDYGPSARCDHPGVVWMDVGYGPTRVDDPSRFGPRLTARWVRAFFGGAR